jgi:virginiamycin B lyase
LPALNVSFDEWTVPTKGSHPHGRGRSGRHLVHRQFRRLYRQARSEDGRAIIEYRLPDGARDPHMPVFDPTGNLWFTDMGANMIGELVPKTGEIKLVSVPTANALPYGIAVNSGGGPCFAEFGTNKPRTSLRVLIQGRCRFTSTRCPTRVVGRDASRSRAMTRADILTTRVGRLDAKTGEARESRSPGGPCGIAAREDIIWCSESGPNPSTLARFDPQAERFETWVIPSGGGVVRNMTATRDGKLVLACSGVGRGETAAQGVRWR